MALPLFVHHLQEMVSRGTVVRGELDGRRSWSSAVKTLEP
jgi:hypothetical protein